MLPANHRPQALRLRNYDIMGHQASPKKGFLFEGSVLTHAGECSCGYVPLALPRSCAGHAKKTVCPALHRSRTQGKRSRAPPPALALLGRRRERHRKIERKRGTRKAGAGARVVVGVGGGAPFLDWDPDNDEGMQSEQAGPPANACGRVETHGLALLLCSPTHRGNRLHLCTPFRL